MAANKLKNILKDKIALEAGFPAYVGYTDYFLSTPVWVRVKNAHTEALSVTVRIESESGLVVPFEERVEVPFESAVNVHAENVFSPLFLAENDALTECEVLITATAEGMELARESIKLTALPYDWWEGLEGNPERIASFVRPRLAECAQVLSEAGTLLKKWKAESEFYGYAGTDKNAVRLIAAAIYGAVKRFSLVKEGESDLTKPLPAAKDGLTKDRTSTAFRLAVFTAACLEAAHLSPVIALGKDCVGVGVWLYDSCFLESVTDDAEIVEKYVSDGINNLTFFDVDDLFVDKSVAFTPSEQHFRRKLQGGMFESFLDIRRCRIGRIVPCPLRGKGLRGYELYKEAEMADESAPAPLLNLKKLKLEGKQPKNKQWERRLLDLSNRNTLLSFTDKNALHLVSADCDTLYARLTEEEVRLKAGTGGSVPFGRVLASQERELVLLEQKKGLVRVFEDAKTLSETAVRLMRKNREADEETGAKILYLALGFLRYAGKEDRAPRYAPLVLAPVRLKRAKGNEDFTLVSEEKEYFVNSTLLEFLKQEFNIDVRGLGGDVSALKISEILAMVRAETASMKGWGVEEECFLSTFSFQRYLMWNDLRHNMGEFKKNALVAALLENRPAKQEYIAPPEEDDADPTAVLLPLPSDSSQYAATALSGAGVSFVLHGPPGTGKSQTITNIIADAMYHGKRVLFVAEKKAALDVVKKRLEQIGIGEFCLELHAGKADRGDLVKRMEDTLALKAEEREGDLAVRAAELVALRDELKEPVRALHKKRRLGVSVYEALTTYLQNKNAPDVLDIESSFYDTLTEKKLSQCRSKILSAAAAAKECGGVFNSPFENVNLTEYSLELRDRVLCASEVLIEEIRHLKSFLSLFLQFYRQRVSTITSRKLDILKEIAQNLAVGAYNKYFSGVNEEAFYLFFNANKRLDTCLNYYYKHFKSLIDAGKEYPALKKFVEAGGDYKLDRAARAVKKRLDKVALHPIAEEDVPKFLETVVELYAAQERITGNTSLSRNFCDRSGGIVLKRRADFLAPLMRLHELCAAALMDYNPDAFNGMCVRAANGYTMPVLEGFLKAQDSFSRALESFLEVTKADRSKLRDEDIFDYYSAKAGALIDNADMLPNWCMYKKTANELSALGLTFITDSLESGKLKIENVLSGFEKNVYKNFLEINIPADPALSRMTAGTLEETVEKFRAAWEEYARLTRLEIRRTLISRLPQEGEEGSLAVELSIFHRLTKSNLRGTGIRGLFTEVPTLSSVIAPCLLMSPTTVAQYLQPQANKFDLVIFDEASQMSTAEAIGSIARAKCAIVVGDPKQLPPTAFFRTAYVDEENLENEDLESVLDDCLALGMPEKHLLWHYRSKHESLIAFSNSMYYDNKLCTFPSPDAMESKVRLVEVDGTYDRGFTKRNRKEAEALVKEVVRRLSDPELSRSSIGIVTFSSAQQEDIERLLQKELTARKLDGAAYDREEPLFVKNLENVQGDERDVILFSVCYGPDKTGRVSLNFGPLNQAGGWRRLNVAVSRAREEMVIFSTITAAMINLQKTSSKGVAGLKAFLEFAERGKTTLAMNASSVKGGAGIGKFIAAELKSYGYDCRCDVGVSEFKIDVAVVDPKDRHRFLLAVICDGTDTFSVKDRNVLQIQTLKRGNWNVVRVNCVNYYSNPKREIKRIKDVLDRLTGAEKKAGAWMSKYKKAYRAVVQTGTESAVFVTGGEHDGELLSRLKEIVGTEEPVSRAFLKRRCIASFGIAKSGSKVDARLDELIDSCAFHRERVRGVDYYYKNPRAILLGKFRTESGTPVRKTEEDLTPFEVVSLIKGVLEDRVALYMDELTQLVAGVFLMRPTEKFALFLRDCVSYGEEKGLFVRSVSDRISLA